MIFDKISLQSIGGVNEGIAESSNQFMQIIHGIQWVMDSVSHGFQQLVEGFGIIGDFFGVSGI